MATLSLCMIAKNEAEFLGKCIEASKEFVDEIIVVDTGSNDGTKEVAKKFGAKVFDFKWCDDFSAARNESLKHANSDWIIYIDADEVISPGDWKKVRELIEIEGVEGYLLHQRNYTFDKTVFGWRPNDDYKECNGTGFFISPITRLFRNKKYFFNYKVHETVDKSILSTKGIVRNSGIPIHHYGYLKESEFIDGKREQYLKLGLSQIKESPSNPRPYYEVAMIYKNTTRFKEAETYFKKVIELDPKYKLVFTSLGEIYTKQGKLKEAIEAYKKSIELKNDENAFINLGMLSHKIGNSAEAIKLFKKALEISPRHPVAYNNLGLLLIQSKRYRAALEIFEQGAKQTGLKKFKEAVKMMKKRFSEPLLIEKLMKKEKYDELESHLLLRVKKNPEDIIAYTHLGNLFLKLDNKKKAVKVLQEAIKYNKTKDPLCINLYVNLSNLFIEAERWDDAKETIESALKIDSEDEFLQKKLEFVEEKL